MAHNQGFPSDFLPRSVKSQDKYGLQVAKAIYGNYVKNNQSFTSRRAQILKNRQFSEGMQDPEIYKELLDITGDASYLNLDFDIIAVIPVFVDLLVGEFSNQQYKVNAEAIDQISLTDRDYERARLMANLKLKELNEYIKASTGIDLEEGQTFIPNSVDEIDLHMQLNYKLDVEIVIEEFIKYVFDQNNSPYVAEKIFRDLVENKQAAARCFINQNDDIEYRYVDIANLVTPSTSKEDFSDCKFAAEILTLPIHQIRRLDKSISEEDLFKIAKANCGEFGNPDEWEGGSYQSYYSNSDVLGFYDNFLIPVLDFQFISIDIKTFEEKNNNYGGIYFNEKGFGYKSSDKNKKIYDKEIEFKYGGFWVVGTEILIDYGVKEDILRKKKNNVYSSETELDYIIYSPNIRNMTNKSLVERMIPHAHAIQIACLKMQQLVAKLRPSGNIIDIGSLENVLIGKMTTSDPLKIWEFYKQTGDLFIDSRDSEGNYMNRPPVQDTKDDLGNVFTQLIEKYNFHRQQIRDITGLNEIRDGISPDSNTPVYVQQASLKASRNSTRGLLSAYQSILLRAAEHISIYVSDLIQQGRIDNYKNILGKTSIDLLKLNKDLELAEVGIKLEPVPEEEDQLMIEQSIQISLQQKELRWEDAMAARDLAKQSTKKTVQFIALKRKQYMEDEMKKNQANVQANAQAQQQSNQQTAQNAQMTAEQMHKFELERIQLEKDLERRNMLDKAAAEEKQILLQGQVKSEHIQKQADESFKSTALQNSMAPKTP